MEKPETTELFSGKENFWVAEESNNLIRNILKSHSLLILMEELDDHFAELINAEYVKLIEGDIGLCTCQLFMYDLNNGAITKRNPRWIA